VASSASSFVGGIVFRVYLTFRPKPFPTDVFEFPSYDAQLVYHVEAVDVIARPT
jgi:hypothetical protein